MTVEAIREVMHRNRPFSLKAADGSEYLVAHPDFVSIGRGEDGIVVVHTESGLAILDVFNITAIALGEQESADTEG